MSETAVFRHRTSIQIRFKDIDSMGHVNNANHFTYLGVMSMEAIPEPASVMMLIGGLATLCLHRSRRQEVI